MRHIFCKPSGYLAWLDGSHHDLRQLAIRNKFLVEDKAILGRDTEIKILVLRNRQGIDRPIANSGENDSLRPWKTHNLGATGKRIEVPC